VSVNNRIDCGAASSDQTVGHSGSHSGGAQWEFFYLQLAVAACRMESLEVAALPPLFYRPIISLAAFSLSQAKERIDLACWDAFCYLD